MITGALGVELTGSYRVRKTNQRGNAKDCKIL